MTSYPYNLSVTSSLSNKYLTIQQKKTDGVCIIGFADCPTGYLNNVYPVYDIPTALEIFSGSGEVVSSLQRGLLEAYYSGCMDLFLLPIGTMSEYVPFENGRDPSFYTSLDAKNTVAASVLKDYDAIDLVVAYDVNPLADNSFTIFSNSANSYWRTNQQSFILPAPTGCLSWNNNSLDSKFISIVSGEGIFDFSEVGAWRGNLASMYAGMISKLDINVPPDNIISNTANVLITDYEGYESSIEAKRIVGFRKTINYIRGKAMQTSSTLAHTMAASGSDFSSMHSMNIVTRLVKQISDVGIIGTTIVMARQNIEKIFTTWLDKGYARNISISYDYSIPYQLGLNITIQIASPTELITVNTMVGPLSN